MPTVAVDLRAPLAPKAPPCATAWSECRKDHKVLAGVDAWVTGEKLPKSQLYFCCNMACGRCEEETKAEDGCRLNPEGMMERNILHALVQQFCVLNYSVLD